MLLRLFLIADAAAAFAKLAQVRFKHFLPARSP